MASAGSGPAGVNVNAATVRGFGAEWTAFDQSGLSESELHLLFEEYFEIFPWHLVREDSIGFDAGCGSGRWAARVAPRVGRLHCVDASPSALEVARRNLARSRTCELHLASVAEMPFPDGSMDFGYSLGVLHHMPDTPAGVRACAAKLKPGAPLLLYLYYALEQRPWWFKAIFRAQCLVRRFIFRLPFTAKRAVSDVIAALVYLPLARAARLAEALGRDVHSFPLTAYRRRSFYVMRTDALDRFGTRLEQRFTRDEIAAMMTDAGLEHVEFSPNPPYWCAVGYRASSSA